MPRESYISIAFLDPSPVLSQLSNCPFLVSFPLCLSRNRGWTCPCSIRPLRLTWARNIELNSSALITSPLFQLYEKQALKEYASHIFTWSARYKEAPWRHSSFIIICCMCIQPASPYIHHAHFLWNSRTSPTPHALCYLFSRQPLLLKADIQTENPTNLPHLSLF